jgi:cytochrome c oxidase subunit 2
MFRKPILFALMALALARIACGIAVGPPKTDERAGRAVTTETASNSQSGQELFTQQGCSACHVEGAGHIAPSLDGLFGETVSLETGESVIADDDYLRESILSPREKIVAGYEPVMPPFDGRITDEELISLVDYIKSLDE